MEKIIYNEKFFEDNPDYPRPSPYKPNKNVEVTEAEEI